MAKKRRMSRRWVKKESPVESHLEHALFEYWRPRFEEVLIPQFVFHPVRQWRFDFAHPELFLAIEIQGYGSGHTSRQGMANDYMKHNEALRLGWGIVYLMGKDLLPTTISTTCAMIRSIMDTRRSSKFLEAVREINGTRKHLPTGNTEWESHLDRVRRKLTEGSD